MSTVIKNARIVSNNAITEADVLIKNGKIEKIESSIIVPHNCTEIDANGNYLLPGLIDDQVHFREPGLTHKATIYTESRAALAGGVTSFMEMPNVNPQTTTIPLLEEKMAIGARDSWVNYSFYLGATNTNLDEVKKVNSKDTCGVKAFLGSSTGNMLVEDNDVLEKLFANCPTILATHCEDEKRIKLRTQQAIDTYDQAIPPSEHPIIRDEEACYISSSNAVSLARKHGTRLHVLHISTMQELDLFDNSVPLKDKKITSEACVHHLHFTASDYEKLGNLIKCNPAIKDAKHKPEIWKAVLDNRIDVIATDHAPHTWQEKQNPYLTNPSGLPLVQHSLQLMLQAYSQGKIELTKLVEKMCHAPAELFNIDKRGYIAEGYYADLVLISENKYKVTEQNTLYKCAWSPLMNHTFNYSIDKVWVNGNLGFDRGVIIENRGMRLMFNR